MATYCLLFRRHLKSIIIICLIISGCSLDSRKKPASSEVKHMDEASRGIGKYTNVPLTDPLDQQMIASGEKVYQVKCAACHKLSDEKLVGPGWKGVTGKRKPEWIMNFITNTDEMIDKDPQAQALLEICMVRMPNQHLTDDDARNVLEFMRNNDTKK